MFRQALGLLMLVPALAFADTTWVTPGDVEGEWTAEHSPYMVQFAIRVPTGATLSIGPGVEVNFRAIVRLTVDGHLWANGTATDSIYFTRNPGDSLHRWSGLGFTFASAAQFEYCVFEWMNAAQTAGITVGGSAVSFEHSTFRHNLSRTVYVLTDQEIGFSDCDFVHSGTLGAGAPGCAIYLNSGSAAMLRTCFLAYNGALDGGAIQANSGALLDLDRCVFKNNHAGIWGGAIYAGSATIRATRCTFVGNRGQQGSHIMAVGSGATTTLNSCIFAFSRHIGGAFSFNGHVPAIRNCAIFGNNPIFQSGVGPPGFFVLDHVNENGTPCDRYANIFVDPMFADTSSDSLNLQFESPCLNAADSTLAWDADGTPPDIGAIPVLFGDGTFGEPWTTIHFVGGFTGLGCPCAYPLSLRDGASVRLRRDRTNDGDTPDDPIVSSFAVTTGAGLPPWDGYWTPRPDSELATFYYYGEVLDGACRWISGHLQFPGGDTASVGPDGWLCEEHDGGGNEGGGPGNPGPTLVCGNVSGVWDSAGSPYIATCDLTVPASETLEIGPGVRVEFAGPYTFFVHGWLTALGTETDSIIFTSDTTVLDQRWQGIQLRPVPHPTGGVFSYCVIENAYYQTPGPVEAGGGVRALECNPEFYHCWIRNNRSVDNGGGLAGNLSSPFVWECRFTGNQALHGGGAVFNGTAPEFYNCIFEHNRGNQGGGIGFWNCAATVVNCTFAYNHGDDAGGIRSITSALTIENSIFVSNTAWAGIQVYSPTAVPVIRYNSFYQNPQPVFGDGSTPHNYGLLSRVNLNGDSCDSWDNIIYDPLLVNPLARDYRLQSDSPCIDAGDPSYQRDPDSTISDIGAIPFLRLDSWTTVHFPGGFAGIGCPCSYPLQLPDGSQVRLRRDVTRNGPTLDDAMAGYFSISSGAGLPPWDGYWTPRPDSQLTVDSFYVELLTDACCWLSGNLRFGEGDTAVVDLTGWSCHDTGGAGGCLSAESAQLPPGPQPSDTLKTARRAEFAAVPNPFNATTEIRLRLADAQRVELTIFDITGREVAQLVHGDYAAGTHRVHFDGSNLATGIYFVSLRSGSDVTVRKLLLLK